MLDQLERAIVAFQEGPGTIEDVAAAFYASARARRVIAHACYSFGAQPDFRDDVCQEVGLLLTARFVHEIRDAERTYNVLHRTAVNIVRRKVSHSGEASLEAIVEQLGETEASTAPIMRDPSEPLEDALAARLDRERAMLEFTRRSSKNTGGSMGKRQSQMPGLDSDPYARPEKVFHKRSAATKAPSAENKYSPGPEGRELSDIRLYLAYTVPEFAQVLGVSKGTLGSYLYGVVKQVPAAVMAEARALRAQSSGGRHELARRWASVSMKEQVAKWSQQLGIEPGPAADTDLARALEVDRATVWRWRSREMRPPPEQMDAFDRRVAKLATQTAQKKRR
jgi:DNA-binding transcriptional regulator YiaG